jgi:uncharacterized membrane protein
MHNYIAVIFDDRDRAYEGLHALWQMDDEGLVTVHGTALVHRTVWGHFQVDSKETHPAMATAFGVGIGALLGLLAGPAGVAVGAASGAAIGAAVGGSVGAATDIVRANDRDLAEQATAFQLRDGQSAVIGNVTEYATAAIDARMKQLGGKVHRRDWSSLQNDAWFAGGYPHSYLYPYEYVPPAYML